MASDAEKDAWILRVLGVLPRTRPPAADDASGHSPEPVAADLASRWSAARQAWTAANAVVDEQIGGLQRVLLATDDEELHRIAELGLNAITASHRVPVMAAVAEAADGSSAALARAVAKGLPAVRAFRQHLASDPRVKACDTNPFGVTTSIAATLGTALGQLEDVFALAAADAARKEPVHG